MRLRIVIAALWLSFAWPVHTGAGPMGSGLRIYPEFHLGKKESFSAPALPYDFELDLWQDFKGTLIFPETTLFDRMEKEEGPGVRITAFLFSYGSYLHDWNMPYFETWSPRGPQPPEPSHFRLPLPETGFALTLEDRYQYPYQHLYAIERGSGPAPPAPRSLLLPDTRARYAYPFSPTGQVATWTPEGPLFQSPEELGYVGRPGTPPGVEQPPVASLTAGREQFREDVAISREAGKPYGMIVLGGVLAATAAIFRYFKLSSGILLVWVAIYGRDIWRIIVDLV